MDALSITLLVGAGVVGGVVNAIAGGATLITFPTMLAMGLPPIVANASNAVAIAPGHIVAALADRRKLPSSSKRVAALSLAAFIGGSLGALLLLAIPENLFTLPVPALIAFATALFAIAPSVQARAAWHSKERVAKPNDGAVMLALASVYGGFFGAGLGIILTAALSISEPNDIRAVKALKNFMAGIVSLSAILIFTIQGVVAWAPTLVMLLGALAGGYLGGYLIRVLPAQWVRGGVIVAGIIMTVIYANRYWFYPHSG